MIASILFVINVSLISISHSSATKIYEDQVNALKQIIIDMHEFYAEKLKSAKTLT